MNSRIKRRAGMFIAGLYLLMSGGLMAQDLPGKIQSSVYQDALSAPDTYLEVVLLLADRVDLNQLAAELDSQEANQAMRVRRTFSRLQQKAGKVQPSLLSRLTQMDGVRKGSLRTTWLFNTILAEIRGETLLELAKWPAIGYIQAPVRIEPHLAERNGTAAAVAPNGHETGLEVINAPALWALGYTGYGRKAYIFDTGVDMEHPAVRGHFSFHHRPLDQAWFGPEPEPFTCGSHGTHVTGTILGVDRLTNDTIGVAPDATWMCSPQFTTCGRRQAGRQEVYQWALNPDGDSTTTEDMPDVINMSGGWPNPDVESCNDSLYKILYDVLEILGVAMTNSAGNSGPDPSSNGNPAIQNWGLVKTFSIGNLNGNSPALTINNSSSRGPSICFSPDSSLYIKPEVSAPGTNVRSSVVGGGYDNYTGTSMSAPHTAGAILLLKEAFPYLSGQDLMLALYFSARDLGEPGEDNEYGMGLIDVLAAYQYLLDQGNVPIPPLSAEHDVIMYDLTVGKRINCKGSLFPFIRFENAGRDTLRSLNIIYRTTNGVLPADTLQWTGLLAPDAIADYSLPVLEDLPPGHYELEVILEKPNGETDLRNRNNRFKRIFSLLDQEPLAGGIDPLFPDTNCRGSQVLLEAQAPPADGQFYEWYSAEEGGVLLDTGSQYLTPPLINSNTFYLDIRTHHQGGKNDPLGGDWKDTISSPAGLIFDALNDFRLESVVVHATTAGTRLVKLRDRYEEVLDSKIIRINETGVQRVDLGIDIPKGEGYELYIDLGRPLAYNTSGVAFPYEVDGVFSIRESLGNDSLSNYHFFYDWIVSTNHACGRSPVDVPVNGALSFSPRLTASADTLYLAQGAEVQFFDSTENAVSWYWDLGNGQTSTEQNPMTQYFEPGTFTVTAIVTSAQGCVNTATLRILVFDQASATIESGQKVSVLECFPNPARNVVQIILPASTQKGARLILYDLLGKRLREKATDPRNGAIETMDLSGLGKGLYLLSLDDPSGRRYTTRIVRN